MPILLNFSKLLSFIENLTILSQFFSFFKKIAKKKDF